ncbi:MAG: hypothetical protein RMJ35_02955 [Phycisphaerales bacterium]|nr:hypothetical protein [Phycisphaerales bacterium]
MSHPPDLQARFERILEHSRGFGPGGREVLETAYHTLAAGQHIGRWPDVGLEDLWAHAIKEGAGLFNRPEARWSKTGPEETRDMLGQTTIGVWQITISNIKQKYGLAYGISPEWPENRVFSHCRDRPQVQAGMICDYIQEAYSQYGRRSPYAIQKYFWLEAFVKKEIGQGAWDRSVLPTAPDGDWRKLTPELKAQTGFYAKQIVLGSPTNPHGLIWWLWVSGDVEGIREVLATWKIQPARVWDEAAQFAIAEGSSTDQFAISPDDLKYMPDPECRAFVASQLQSIPD